MKAKRVTLRDLARELNLSPATVSRALNGFPEVNQHTKDRVKHAAEKIGYFPDSNAKRLADGKAGAVGLIVDANAENFMEPILAEFLDGVGRELAKTGTDLVIHPVTSADPILPFRQLIAQKSVDAFIVNGPTEYDPRVAYLAESGFPFVLHGQTKGAGAHCSLDIDNFGGFFQAADILCDHGHRRIGFLGGFADQTFTLDRLGGTRAALHKSGLALRDEDIHLGPLTEQTGYRAGAYYFDKPVDQRPTAFLCLSLFVALGLLRAARERSVKMPEDFSIIVHDDRAPYLRAEYFDPPLTAIQSSIRRAGSRVAQMALEHVNAPSKSPTQIIEPIELEIRSSVSRVKT